MKIRPRIRKYPLLSKLDDFHKLEIIHIVEECLKDQKIELIASELKAHFPVDKQRKIVSVFTDAELTESQKEVLGRARKLGFIIQYSVFV